jgi:hypothetical protein
VTQTFRPSGSSLYDCGGCSTAQPSEIVCFAQYLFCEVATDVPPARHML